MKYCCVVFCNNASAPDCGISFHRFPLDGEKRKQWQSRINRVNVKTGKMWEPGKHTWVCSKHFKADDFESCTNFRSRLKPEAVPSVFTYKTMSSTRKRLQPSEKISVPSSLNVSNDVVPVGLFANAEVSETSQVSEELSDVKLEPCDTILPKESCSILFWKDQFSQVSSTKLPSPVLTTLPVVSENLHEGLLKLPTFVMSESEDNSNDGLFTIPSFVMSETLGKDAMSKLPRNIKKKNFSKCMTSQNRNGGTQSKLPSFIASENLKTAAISKLPRIITVENLSDSTISIRPRLITSQNLTDGIVTKLPSFVMSEVVTDNSITADNSDHPISKLPTSVSSEVITDNTITTDNSGLPMSVEQSINVICSEDIDAELEGNQKIDPEIASNRHVLNENLKQIKLIHNYCTTESPGKLKKRNFRLVEALEKKSRLVKTLRQGQRRMREMMNALLKKLHEQQMVSSNLEQLVKDYRRMLKERD